MDETIAARSLSSVNLAPSESPSGARGGGKQLSRMCRSPTAANNGDPGQRSAHCTTSVVAELVVSGPQAIQHADTPKLSALLSSLSHQNVPQRALEERPCDLFGSSTIGE